MRDYRNSGEWGRDISSVTNKAKAWLKKRRESRRAPRKPALVLDIDETSLDNYPCIEAGGFQNTLGLLVGCVVRFNAPAIQQVRSLFRRAKQLKVKVFFITGRPEALRQGTLTNLRKAGYTGGYELVLQPSGYNKPSKVPFKSSARRKIEKRGFTIIANVGDQRSDLNGGFSERRFLLPDPMYFTP